MQLASNSFQLGLRFAFQPEAARGVDATYEIRMEGSAFWARIAEGELETGDGSAEDPDLTIATDIRLGELMRGEISPKEAVAQGVVELDGKRSPLRSFAQIFRVPGPRATGNGS